MLAFRSEGHLERWLDRQGLERGAAFDLPTLHELARAWYGGRLDPAWRPRTPQQAERVLREAGLDGPFWRLA